MVNGAEPNIIKYIFKSVRRDTEQSDTKSHLKFTLEATGPTRNEEAEL